MKILLVFISPNGTTHKTALLLSEAFQQYGHQVVLLNIGRSPYREDTNPLFDALQQADLVGFGSAAYHMNMLEPMLNLFRQMALQNRLFSFKAFFFLNYSGITTGKVFLLAAKVFTRMNIPVLGAIKVLAPHFHHPLPFPTEKAQNNITEFVKALEGKSYTPITRQQIKDQFQPFTRKVHFIHPFIHLIGKTRELPITIDQQLCKRCGKCVRECPAGAIAQNGQIAIDFNHCLHCYHCVIACPQQAILCPVENLDQMMQTNINLIGNEIPGNQFYV